MNPNLKKRAISLAKTYTLTELRNKHRAAMEQMETGSVITSASTSGGTSYARTIFANPSEMVELYELAIAYKQGEDISDTTITNVRTI